MALDQYLWMTVLGVIFGFSMSFGIGANDMANAFGSSVSAKSVSLKQAIFIAAIFEFCGALFLGASVTGTIRSKIVDTKIYSDEPAILMLGMLVALIVASMWLLIATFFELPVSTTHTIVASIIGFSVVAEGFDSVNWKTARQIFISWVASPGVSGAIAFIFFFTVKKLVLTHENSYAKALLVYPVVLFVAITINLYFILYKGTSNFSSKLGDNFGRVVVIPVSFGGGLLVALIFTLFIGPRLKQRVDQRQEEIERQAAEDEAADKKPEEAVDVLPDGTSKTVPAPVTDQSMKGKVMASLNNFANKTYRQDLEAQSMHESRRTADIWENRVQYDPRTERMFSYLQVFTASLTSFAHGANDVANAIAPVSAILAIYEKGSVPSKSDVKKWILALGGFGMVLGFTLFGYRIIKAVGYKLTHISPSRGFCIELATSLVVVTASFVGLPVSSTQCLVGATVGAGLAGGVNEVQWLQLLKVAFGWVVTFFLAALSSAAVFAFCAFSPTLVQD